MEKDQAKACYKKVIEKEPWYITPYWSLVSISIEEKDYKEVTSLLMTLEFDRYVELTDLKGEEFYADFVKSEEYSRWSGLRKEKREMLDKEYQKRWSKG